MAGYVYIMSNKPKGVLYIGVTSNIEQRVFQHKKPAENNGFTARYNLDKLVYLEETFSIEDAIAREKQLKNWHREWKINLIESQNPNWMDLASQFAQDPETSSG
jgi:putative endonuclease